MTTYFVQAVTAGCGSLGFAVLFNIRGKQLRLIFGGGVISWVSYLLFLKFSQNDIVAMFGATLTVALIAEFGARIVKAPVITLMVPMLIPLIPGGNLYHTMSALVHSDMIAFAHYSRQALLEACAIAFGILVVTLCAQIVTKTLRYFAIPKEIRKNITK